MGTQQGNVVFLTGHHPLSRRKAGFHFIAKAFHAAGWNVLFMTAALSPLSWLFGDYRTSLRGLPHNRLTQVADRFTAFLWVTAFHPMNLRRRWLNSLVHPLFELYGSLPLGEAEGALRDADLIVFESFAGMMLFDRIRRMNPRARLVYRVSDDMRWLGLHPSIIAAETAAAPCFDLISSPSRPIHERFAHLPSAILQLHGVDKALFDGETRNPYAGTPSRTTNVVFSGANYLDMNAVAAAAAGLPDWRFHVIGPFPDLPRADNIVAYGEMPMEETVRYVKFADVGLNALTYRPHGEALTDTLKMRQYTYCRLPIVVPDYVERAGRTHIHAYRPEEPASIVPALRRAAAHDRGTVDAAGIHGWEEFLPAFAGHA